MAHVLAMATLSLPVVLALWLYFGGMRRASGKDVLVALTLAFLVEVVIFIFTMAISPWYPIRVLTVATLCAAAAGAYLRENRWYGLGAFMAAGAGLVVFAWALEGTDAYIKLYRHRGTRDRMATGDLADAKDTLKRLVRDQGDIAFPPGWAHEVFHVYEGAGSWVNDRPYPDFEIEWHSWLTQLARSTGCRPYGLWYPGGPLKGGIESLEIRDRPVHPQP